MSTSSFTDSTANSVLDAIFTGLPSTIYISLLLERPNPDGSNILEPDLATGYSRVAISNNSTNFPTATSRLKSNGVEIPFGAISGALRTAKYVGIHNSATGGDLLVISQIEEIQIGAGSEPKFSVGNLKFSFDWVS